MKNKAFKIIFKVFVLTSIFFVIINYFGYFINASEIANKSTNLNKEKFKSNNIDIIGNVGVAITTNIGTRYKQTKETPINIYKDVIEIGHILGNQNIAKDKIITANMIFVNEYFNVLKTDIRSLISSSLDREFTLNSFISQLEFRYRTGLENVKNLNIQKTELLKSYESSEIEIEQIKNKISTDFSEFNNQETVSNIDAYLKLNEEKLNARTYIIFINKFLDYYAILNNYNKKVLDTLINNKEILIKNSQVVIPDTGGELLEQLKIIYTEKEWKESK